MRGKVCLVTGATNGIGKVTALELAKMGATVIIVGRNPDKTEAVVNEVRAQSGNDNVKKALADLSSMADVRALAQEFKRTYSRLDVLVNNAGAYFNKRHTTVDGYEMTFALNHLSYFLLTALLLDVLKSSAPARIVNVSSDAHRGARLDFNNLHGEQRFSGIAAYARSKLANVLFTYELVKRLQGTNVTANALHPGFVATGFGANNGLLMRAGIGIMTRLMGISPEEGAKTTLYLASSPEVEGVTGKYFDKCRVVQSSAASYEVDARERLWQVSEQLCGVTVPA
jgi:NAD(P)-dependent dehydrogenase (short-subunit alcohol dehydrogenase family)